MPLPAPKLGLVVQYGFIWRAAGRRKPPDSGKNRPCLIIDLEQVSDPRLRVTTRVIYLPISHVPPRAQEAAYPIPPRVAQHLGLTPEPSYLYTSYAVEDDWPFDLTHIPGSADRFDYGFVPPKLFAIATAAFTARRRANPGFIHKP